MSKVAPLIITLVHQQTHNMRHACPCTTSLLASITQPRVVRTTDSCTSMCRVGEREITREAESKKMRQQWGKTFIQVYSGDYISKTP